MMKKVITRKSRKYYRNLKNIEHRRKTREELVSLGKCEFGKVKNSLVKVRTVLEVNKSRKQEKGCSGYKTSHSKMNQRYMELKRGRPSHHSGKKKPSDSEKKRPPNQDVQLQELRDQT